MLPFANMVPVPINYFITRWLEDPYSRGSYSKVESKLDKEPQFIFCDGLFLISFFSSRPMGSKRK
jgi:hypothetical protein